MIGAVIDTLFKAVVGAMKAHGSVGGVGELQRMRNPTPAQAD